MTVTYDAGSKRFEVYDGEENVADLTTAKGSAPADDDTTYIYTDTSEGILGISPGETMKGTIYVGKKPDGSDSAGTLKIYGGGTYQMAASVSLELNPGYGTLKTSGTTSASHATINANQCNNDLKLTGGLDCDLLDITNIKSGGTVDLQDATGTLLRTSFSGYSGASFSITGVPDEGFFARGISLGRAVSGIYTESGYPDIDLVNDAAIVEVTAERSTGATALAVHIETHPCHIASLPVAVNIQCHSSRHKEVEL